MLKTAKKKGKCGGEMAINPAGELDVTPKGSAPSSLAKGIQIAARSANAMVFSGVNILPEQPEEAEEKTNGDPGSRAPSTTSTYTPYSSIRTSG